LETTMPRPVDRIRNSLERQGVQSTGPFLDILIQLFSTMLANCQHKPDVPPTPQPATSTATAEGWKKADEAKAIATEHYHEESNSYDRDLLNRTAAGIRRKKRHEKDKISKPDALKMAATYLDESRNTPLEDAALEFDRVSQQPTTTAFDA